MSCSCTCKWRPAPPPSLTIRKRAAADKAFEYARASLAGLPEATDELEHYLTRVAEEETKTQKKITLWQQQHALATEDDEQEELMGEIRALKKKLEKIQAIGSKIKRWQQLKEKVEQEEQVKQAIELIVEREIALPTLADDDPARKPEEVAALTTKLQALKMRALMARAAASGADEATLDLLDKLRKEQQEQHQMPPKELKKMQAYWRAIRSAATRAARCTSEAKRLCGTLRDSVAFARDKAFQDIVFQLGQPAAMHSASVVFALADSWDWHRGLAQSGPCSKPSEDIFGFSPFETARASLAAARQHFTANEAHGKQQQPQQQLPARRPEEVVTAARVTRSNAESAHGKAVRALALEEGLMGKLDREHAGLEDALKQHTQLKQLRTARHPRPCPLSFPPPGFPALA